MPDQAGLHEADHHRSQRRSRRSRGSTASRRRGGLPVRCLRRRRHGRIAKRCRCRHCPSRPRQRAGQFSRRHIARQPDRHHAGTVRQAYGDQCRGPFFMMQGVVRHLLETGKPGSMVNILSTSAHVGQSFLSAYSTSKGGLVTLTKNTANAYRANLIRCNGVAPGWMDTPGEDVVQKDFPRRARRLAGNGYGRAADGPAGQAAPDRTADRLSAEPDSGIITGTIIDYDQQIIGAVPE